MTIVFCDCKLCKYHCDRPGMPYPASDECINKQIIIDWNPEADFSQRKATCVSFERKGARITKGKKILREIK